MARSTFSAVAILAFATTAHAQASPNGQTIVVRWNAAFLQAVRDSSLGPTMVARALAVAHTCIYDAWAAYDERAVGTAFNPPQRPPVRERSFANRQKAISFAAYRAAVDLFPWDEAKLFDPLMAVLGYDANDTAANSDTPAGIGNAACAAVLKFRHNDGANQLGMLTGGVPYGDYTHYVSPNSATMLPVQLNNIVDPYAWTPLTYFNGTATVTPSFVGAQFYIVTPFALTTPGQFLSLVSPYGPAGHNSPEFVTQAQELVDISRQLTDRQKMIAEYWANGPRSELPPGHWDLFAQYVSARDNNTVDEDVKLFFALTNAIFDAGIAAWDAKRVYNSVRPITAVPYLFHGQTIHCWGGPGAGTVAMDGANWLPYQPLTFPTPPFPEFVSGHSAFSAAGATILALATGKEDFGASVTFPAGSSTIEPGITPAQAVTLYWKTFHDAADEAGISRRYGGIHFRAGDLAGRALGDAVGRAAWAKAQQYIEGGAR
jgi:hypothetical protein